MNARSLSQITIVVLFALGAILVTLRHSARREYQVSQANSFWRLTYDVTFEMDNDPDTEGVELRVALPSPAPPAELVVEQFTAPGLTEEDPWVGDLTGTRERRFTARHGKVHRVTAKFHINTQPRSGYTGPLPLEGLTADAKAMFLRGEPDIPVQGPNVRERSQAIPNDIKTLDEKIEWIYDQCLGFRSTTSKDGGDDVEMVLATDKATPLGRVKAFVAVCRASGIPARLVTGFELRRVDQPHPHVWAEAFRANQWVPFDPEYGYARTIPSNFVPVRWGGDQIVEVIGGKITSDAADRYTIERLSPKPETLQSGVRSPVQIFDLTRLPLEMHGVLKIVLLLPLGALITAIFRNIIGIRTLGTFAPALLAMSFIYAALGTGIFLLFAVVVAGLFGRTMLERLHMLMVPRLSFVLTMIILCLVFGVSLVDYMSEGLKPQAILFPLVILTTLIERFHVTTEEDGFPFALQLAVGTLVVAAFCYLILKWDDVGRLILIYPEAHFFTLGAFVFIGRYTGYRVTELWRFRDAITNRDNPE